MSDLAQRIFDEASTNYLAMGMTVGTLIRRLMRYLGEGCSYLGYTRLSPLPIDTECAEKPNMVPVYIVDVAYLTVTRYSACRHAGRILNINFRSISDSVRFGVSFDGGRLYAFAEEAEARAFQENYKSGSRDPRVMHLDIWKIYEDESSEEPLDYGRGVVELAQVLEEMGSTCSINTIRTFVSKRRLLEKSRFRMPRSVLPEKALFIEMDYSENKPT